MDSTFLYRLETTLQSIKSNLLLYKEIRKLLYHETDSLGTANSAHEFENAADVQVESVRDNIFLQPIVEVDNDPPFNKKMFLSITSFQNGFVTGNSFGHAIKIDVMCDKTNWVTKDNHVRVLHLCQRIINILDGMECACAGTLTFESITDFILDKTIQGKTIYLSVVDGVGEE